MAEFTSPPGGGIFSSEGGKVPPFTSENSPTGKEGGVNAVVSVGPIPVTDNQSQFKHVGLFPSIFSDYEIRHKYESDKHIYMLPITSPDGFLNQSVAFARLASATLLWIVDWTVSKIREQPEIPDPYGVAAATGSNWILMDEHLEPVMLMLLPDGKTPIYRISGTYVYGNRNPNATLVNDIRFSRPPYFNDVFPRTMPVTKLTGGLLT